MSDQLALELDVPAAIAVPRPAGLERIEVDDVTYLADFGDEHQFRVLGWYYGYPRCCIEAFIACDAEWRRSPWIKSPPARPHHPVSGHLLCDACGSGPMAPLPDRPARHYGWAVWYSDEPEPFFEPPSDYDGGWRK